MGQKTRWEAQRVSAEPLSVGLSLDAAIRLIEEIEAKEGVVEKQVFLLTRSCWNHVVYMVNDILVVGHTGLAMLPKSMDMRARDWMVYRGSWVEMLDYCEL